MALVLSTLLLALAGCSSVRTPELITPSTTVPQAEDLHPASRWVPSSWSALPGWSTDTLSQAWPALLRSCQRPAPAWVSVCQSAQSQLPQDDDALRAWFETHLQPYLVQSPDGDARGLLTGYYEPVIDARRHPGAGFETPLYGPPADLGTRVP